MPCKDKCFFYFYKGLTNNFCEAIGCLKISIQPRNGKVS